MPKQMIKERVRVSFLVDIEYSHPEARDKAIRLIGWPSSGVGAGACGPDATIASYSADVVFSSPPKIKTIAAPTTEEIENE